MKLQVSLSMPMVSNSTYKPWWAKTTKINAEYLETTLADPTLIHIATTTKGDVHHKLNKIKLNEHEEFIFVADEYLGVQSIQYGVRVKTFDIKGLAGFKTVGQVSVWRNSKYLYLPRGFAAWVFKQVLFPTYGNIVSDSSQSGEGKAFWFASIAEELELGTHVYALGVEHPKPHQYLLEEIHTILKTKEVEEYYSVAPDTRGEFYRILLSLKALTLTKGSTI